MSKKLFPYLKSFTQALLMFIILSSVIDWWRSPTQPSYAAGQKLHLLDRHTVELEQFSRNETAILYFWGSWCEICRHTSPSIEKLHQQGVPVISVALNSGDNQTIRQYLNKKQLTFPTINDSDGLISKRWQINVTPTVVLIKNGKMIHATTGLSTYWGLRLRLLVSHFIY